jgi:hypothetical protein
MVGAKQKVVTGGMIHLPQLVKIFAAIRSRGVDVRIAF